MSGLLHGAGPAAARNRDQNGRIRRTVRGEPRVEWPLFSGAGTTTARICRIDEPSPFARPAVSIPVHLAGIGAMSSRHAARVHPAQRRAVGEGPALCLLLNSTTGWSCRRWFGVRLRRSRGARPRSRRGHRHGVALGENGFQCARLAPVDGENVLLPHLDDPTRKPAPVPFRQPLGRVLVVLLVPIYRRTCERQIQRVIGEPAPGVRAGGAQPAVMRLGTGHQVLDVGLPLRGQTTPPYRASRCRRGPR